MDNGRTQDARDNPGVIAPPPLIYLVGLLAGFVLGRALRTPALRRPRTRIVGAALASAGLSLMRNFFVSFKRADTPINPARSARTLVVEGPYRFTRNPAYLGMALLYSGIALMRGAVGPLLTLPAVIGVIDRGVIAREEGYLSERFGEPYLEYCTRVRRWV